MSSANTDSLTLVYACSGCSSAAQLANHLAVRLDREGYAEMSCIAGVGGGVPSLVRKAQEAQQTGRPVMAIDGCILGCASACLARHDIRPTVHIQLGQEGVKKAYHADFDAQQAEDILADLRDRVQVMNELYQHPHHSQAAGGCGGTGQCRCSG